MKNKLTPYQCCWCSEKILWSEILILQIKKPTTAQSAKIPEFSQQDLYSHVGCMGDKLGSEIPFLFREG